MSATFSPDRAHGTICGWCGEPYAAWMDLDEWVCANPGCQYAAVSL